MDEIFKRSAGLALSKTSPNDQQLKNAVQSYSILEIKRDTLGNLEGKGIAQGYKGLGFLNVFADHLYHKPNDPEIIEKSSNTLLWMATCITKNSLGLDYAGYAFRSFANKGVFLGNYVSEEAKRALLFIMDKNSNHFNIFWKKEYNYETQQKEGVINTDFIYNTLVSLIPIFKCFPNPEEQCRYLRTLRRYITRFVSTYTNGTQDGIKPDGCGFHHWGNYEAYMYCYNTVVEALERLGTSVFQISQEAYLSFRDVCMHKIWVSSDDELVPLSMTGRTGDWDASKFGKFQLRDLSIVGGKILGLETADPVLAGIYNRRYGVENRFNYNKISEDCGFYQMNHANAGVFRKKNYLILAKGFNNTFWGSEIYEKENRFGRYQSYGALTVVKPGRKEQNGFHNTKWDWNHNPGTTSKILSWAELTAARTRIDERNGRILAGSLAYDLKNYPYLQNFIGNFGLFVMDFKEVPNLGWGGKLVPCTHDASFTFRKSVFFFDDFILCVGSNISNNDKCHPTITTLFQNCTVPKSFLVNNVEYKETEKTEEISLTQPNWLIDNFGTGFFILPGNGKLKFKMAEQSTPSPHHNEKNLNKPSLANIAWIDHGTTPKNETYEYILVPEANPENMFELSSRFEKGNRPYNIVNVSVESHIVYHLDTGICAATLFSENQEIPGGLPILSNSRACLLMFQTRNNQTEMRLGLCNPHLGLKGFRDLGPYPEIVVTLKLRGKWRETHDHPSVKFMSFDGNSSVFDFTTYQGIPIQVELTKETSMGNTSSNENCVPVFYEQPQQNEGNNNGSGTFFNKIEGNFNSTLSKFKNHFFK